MKSLTLHIRNKQCGFSTIELAVATLIGLFVLLAVVSVMVSTQKNYASNDATARLQENARFAMTALAYDLRMAGYAGCIGSDDSTIDPISGVQGDPDDFISDSFTVQYADPQLGTFELASVQPLSTAQIDVVNASSTSTAQAVDVISAGDTIVIADCGSVQLHDVASVSGNSIMLDGSTFSASTANVYRVMRLMTYEYSIDFDPTTNTPTLYREENGGSREPLVEGIEYLRVLFGIDNTGDNLVDTYVSPSSLTTSSQVTNIKLGLLARSVSYQRAGQANGAQYGPTTDTKTYEILDLPAYDPPDDRVSRQVFVNNLLVRNG